MQPGFFMFLNTESLGKEWDLIGTVSRVTTTIHFDMVGQLKRKHGADFEGFRWPTEIWSSGSVVTMFSHETGKFQSKQLDSDLNKT
jgi:hypothetical protein